MFPSTDTSFTKLCCGWRWLSILRMLVHVLRSLSRWLRGGERYLINSSYHASLWSKRNWSKERGCWSAPWFCSALHMGSPSFLETEAACRPFIPPHHIQYVYIVCGLVRICSTWIKRSFSISSCTYETPTSSSWAAMLITFLLMLYFKLLLKYPSTLQEAEIECRTLHWRTRWTNFNEIAVLWLLVSLLANEIIRKTSRIMQSTFSITRAVCLRSSFCHGYAGCADGEVNIGLPRAKHE